MLYKYASPQVAEVDCEDIAGENDKPLRDSEGQSASSLSVIASTQFKYPGDKRV